MLSMNLNKTPSAIKAILLLLPCVAGCTGSEIAGNPALEIAQFHVAENEAELDVVGSDSVGNVVAKVTVQLGQVKIAEEDLQGEGRALTVQLHGKRMDHTDIGNPHVWLPRLGGDFASMNELLLDPHVATPLLRWGIALAEETTAQPASELAYATNCTHSFSASCGTVTDCSEYVGNQSIDYEDVCCPGSLTTVNRECVGVPGCAPTGTYGATGCPSGSSPMCPIGSSRSGQLCTTTSCGTVGPLGCAVCWSSGYTSSCSTLVCSASSASSEHDGVYRTDGSCTAQCSGKNCGDDNGCGGTCPNQTCPGGKGHCVSGGTSYCGNQEFVCF